MAREVKLNEIEKTLGELDYPVERSTAAETLSDVTVLLADGEVNLGKLISDTGSDTYVSVSDLESELNNTIPRGAVGEPYQSEGEG